MNARRRAPLPPELVFLPLGGTGDVSFLSDRDEIAKMAELHAIYLMYGF